MVNIISKTSFYIYFELNFNFQPKKSKFIKKKDSVSFHLVHRSQQDPLTADESAPQRVLLPVVAKSKV